MMLCLSVAMPLDGSAAENAGANEAVSYAHVTVGSQPQVNLSDYDGYLTSIAGTSVLTGRIIVTLNSGERVVCNRSSDVELYPDTPFTRWMIAKWAADRDGKDGGFGEPTMDPNEHWVVPQILSFDIELSARKAVRSTPCSQTGSFVFTGLPAGKYFAISIVTRYGGPYSAGAGGSLIETNTPDGPHLAIGSAGASGGREPSDGYLVVSRFPVVIRAGSRQSFSFVPDDFRVIAHASEKT